MPIGDPNMAGTFSGTVVRRDDPEGDGRIKVEIPGVIEGESAWCRRDGGGAKNYGTMSVPPEGATVIIEFINRDIDTPMYRAGWYGKPLGKAEVFPEYQDPDIHVWGVGPFRVVVDDRDPADTGNPRSIRMKMVKEVAGAEEDIVWIEINEDNSLQIHADNSIGLDAGGILDLIGTAGLQIQGRKVMRGSTRPIA